MLKLKSKYEGESARMEMTPLMDVVFLLLVFFRICRSSYTLTTSNWISLPEAQAESSDASTFEFLMTADGTILFDERGN